MTTLPLRRCRASGRKPRKGRPCLLMSSQLVVAKCLLAKTRSPPRMPESDMTDASSAGVAAIFQ
eukprot:4028298-Pyramimonas_sp.AAC.1